MNSQFIRTFADDLAKERKKWARHSEQEQLISDIVVKLHRFAIVLEKLEFDQKD